MTHVSEQKEDIFPIVFGALQTNTGHWNATVNGLTTQVLKLLMDLDPALYDKCNADFVQVCRPHRGDSWQFTPMSIA